jgi:hypothetical protein
MTTFINDEGQEIQYSGDDILITKQVASFKNFKIKGDVSVSFEIPNTSANRTTLGYFGLNQSDSPTFSLNAFNLVKNGNTLMRGYLVIEEDLRKTLNVYFISGNANWFRAFDLSCKDIRNDGYRVRWSYTWVNLTKGNTTGIIFPMIDYMFGRQKFDRFNFFKPYFGEEVDRSNTIDSLKPNNFPCLYINTLVNELAKVANIRLAGSLFTDKLYNSLIITPEGPELYNENGAISPFDAATDRDANLFNNLISIQDIAPQMKAIEIIKYVIFKFGCVASFDEFTQTLTLNIVDKFKKEDAEDWSEYIVDYKIQYNQNQNNYIRVAEAQEEEIQLFNLDNQDNLFGELNIEAQKQDGSTVDLYSDPFAPVKDDVGTTPINWHTPFVQFYELQDGEPIPYTSVADDGSGNANFFGISNLATSEIYSSGDGLVFRVEDDNGTYTGYHIAQSAGGDQILSYCLFDTDSTGTMYIQNISYVSNGPRILVCAPNLGVTNFMASNVNSFTIGDIETAAWAYWHKPHFSYTALNGYKPGLSWGDLYFAPNDISVPPGPPPPVQYSVTVFVTADGSTSGIPAKIYYQVDGGTWTLLKSLTIPVTPTYTTIDIPITEDVNSTISIGVLNAANVNVTYGISNTAGGTFTGYCGQDTDTLFTLTGNTNKYVNISVSGGLFVTC